MLILMPSGDQNVTILCCSPAKVSSLNSCLRDRSFLSADYVMKLKLKTDIQAISNTGYDEAPLYRTNFCFL